MANRKRVKLTWQHGMAFAGGVDGKPQIDVDAEGATGPDPGDFL